MKYTIHDTEVVYYQPDVKKLANLARRWGIQIFNNGDRNRLQYECGLSKQSTIRSVMAKTTALLNQKYPTHIVNDWFLLHSRENCPRQPAHADYHPSILDPAKNIPMFAILAIEDKTTVDIWLDSDDNAVSVLSTHNPVARRVTISIPSGCVFVARGDLIHAGSMYGGENTRFHTFLDVPGITRPADRTYLVEMDTNFTNLDQVL